MGFTKTKEAGTQSMLPDPDTDAGLLHKKFYFILYTLYYVLIFTIIVMGFALTFSNWLFFVFYFPKNQALWFYYGVWMNPRLMPLDQQVGLVSNLVVNLSDRSLLSRDSIKFIILGFTCMHVCLFFLNFDIYMMA